VQLTGWGRAERAQQDRNLATDLDAYKRLRNDGELVARTKGARNLERTAEIPQELRLGMALPKDVKQALKQGDGEIVGL